VCEAGIGNPVALTLADELGTDAFFAAHADVIRVSYYALRGDRETAEQHRARAEELALRGGSAWSAAGTLISLSGFAACLSEDAVGLVQLISDLDVFADASPAFRTYQRVCAAWLEHIRGHSTRARELFEQAFANEASQSVPTVLVNWGLYANVLNALGDYAQAYAVSSRMLTEHGSTPDHVAARNLFRELAVAQAGLGQHAEARQLATSLLARAEAGQNPMELGLAHRDLARIALITGDPAAFDRHFEAMEAHFGATHNACLIGQCDNLLAKAEACGLRIVRQATVTYPSGADLDGETEFEPSTGGVRR
jgi:tetratricopeptide (TPR) repeat protein